MTPPKPRDEGSMDVARFSHDGEDYVVVSWSSSTEGREQVAALTDAERAVARLVAAGRTNQEIAELRGTALRTVANQVAALLRKLGLPSRTQAALYAARTGLVALSDLSADVTDRTADRRQQDDSPGRVGPS